MKKLSKWGQLSGCLQVGKSAYNTMLVIFRLPENLEALLLSDFLSGLDGRNEDDHIQHMAPDPQNDGNIIFSDRHALFTTDGVTVSIIAGSLTTQGGFQEDFGTNARFEQITSFEAINDSVIIVTDAGNRCLIRVDIVTKGTQEFSGLCGSNDTNITDGDKETATFALPVSVKIDELFSVGNLLVLDVGSKLTWRSVNIDTQSVSTVLESNNMGQTTLDFLISTCHASLIAYVNAGEGYAAVQYIGGQLSTHNFPLNVRHTVLIDAAGHVGSLPDVNAVFLASANVLTFYSICGGLAGNVNGNLSSCQLDKPNALLKYNGALYISVANGIKKIDSKFPICDIPLSVG